MLLKRKPSRGIKTSSTVLIIFFLLAFPGASAAPDFEAGFNSPVPSLSTINIPSELGRIEKNHQGTNNKTIVLIQEAHVDYGAQKAIAEVLKYVICREWTQLVLVEGGWGDVTLSYLRNYGTPERRREVAEAYLKAGKISGEEYLNIISDLNMTLWGIENPELYRENMTAFLKFHEAQNQVVTEVTKLETILQNISEEVFSPTLKEFETARRKYQENQASLPEYLTFLSRQVDPKIFDSLPHLKKLLSMTGASAEFDPDKVNVEKEELVRAVTKAATKLELEQFSLFRNEKAGSKNLDSELQFLKSLMKVYEVHQAKLESAKVRNLVGYMHALETLTGGGPNELFKELERLEKSALEKKALSKNEKTLLEMLRSSELIKRLFKLQLGPDEFSEVENRGAELSFSKWEEFLSQKTDSKVDFALLAKWIPEAKSFYDWAIKRERALVENAVSKMAESGDRTAVLLAGGFHAEHLEQAFQKLGYSVIVIAPRFETSGREEENSAKYFEILKYKWNAGASESAVTFPPTAEKTRQSRNRSGFEAATVANVTFPPTAKKDSKDSNLDGEE